MGLLPARAGGDPGDRRPSDTTAQARHQEGSLTYGDGDLRDQLAQLGRAVTQAGLVVASGGNFSARAPGANRCWVTGAGTWLDRLTRDSFASVALDAAPDTPALAGPPPTTELQLHVEIYRVRPDVNAIVHLHPQITVLLDLLGEPIRLLTTDHAFYLRKVVTTPFASPGTREVAVGAATAVADGTNCVILAHHGCSVLGDTVEMAHRRAVNLEEAARMTYRALVLTAALAGPRSRRREIPECPFEFVYSSRDAV